MTILIALPCCFTQGNTYRIFAWVIPVSLLTSFLFMRRRSRSQSTLTVNEQHFGKPCLNWPAFKHWPLADLIYSTLACVSFYAIVSAAWVVCLGLPSCECMSVYNYWCVCVSQCENVSLLSHMRWQSLSRAPFDIRRILGISQHTLSFWRPTHSLFNLLSWSLCSSLSGFDIKPDYPQCIWYFYQWWQQLLRPEQVPVSTKTQDWIMSRTYRFFDLCVKPFWKDFEQWTFPSNAGHLELTQSWWTDPQWQ